MRSIDYWLYFRAKQGLDESRHVTTISRLLILRTPYRATRISDEFQIALLRANGEGDVVSARGVWLLMMFKRKRAILVSLLFYSYLPTG